MLGAEEFAGDEIPAKHVAAPPVAPLIGGEEVVVIFETNDERVGGGAVLAIFDTVGNGAIGVVEVEGIAIGGWAGPAGGSEEEERAYRAGECCAMFRFH